MSFFGGLFLRKVDNKILLRLFLVFLKIGALTFGGGYAMIPIIQREIVEKRRWITEEEYIDFITVGQTLPGMMAGNVSIFVGNKIAGFLGSVAALAGVVLPSFVIIILVSALLMQYKDNVWVGYAFEGASAGVFILILMAVDTLRKKSLKNALGWVIAVTSFILVAIFKLSVILVLLSCIVLGILIHLYNAHKINKINK